MNEVISEWFRCGDYQAVIEALRPQADLSVQEEALLGIALLRCGDFSGSELPLASAMARGDLEAAVEYGNLLRASNQQVKAIRHLTKLLPTLRGELKFRALRWRGVATFYLGDPLGLEEVEEARLGYLGLRDERTAARLSHTLAALLAMQGDFRAARKHLDFALPLLARDENRRPLLSAYQTLIDIQLELGLLEEAEDTLVAAQTVALSVGEAHHDLHLRARQAALYLRAGDYGAFVQALSALQREAALRGEPQVYTFASNNLANHLSRTGNHAAALRVMAELTERYPQRSIETQLTAALLTMRRGSAPDALGQFRAVAERAERLGATRDVARSTLLAALAAYHMNDFTTALTCLSSALTDIAGWPDPQIQVSLREELRETEELIAHARLSPDLQPIVMAALERATALVVLGHDDLFTSTHRLDIIALGPQPQVLLDGIPLTFRLTYSVPILSYLALHTGRTRQEITADLWGDQDAVRAGANFRQCLAEIRRVVGADSIVISGPHHEPRYALSSKFSLSVDTQRVRQAVHEGDLAGALSAYKGGFLARLPETEWLLEMRSALAGSLTAMLRRSIEEALAQQDDRRVVLLATTLLDIDPEDFEIEALRLARAELVSSPVELAKFQAERQRRLH